MILKATSFRLAAALLSVMALTTPSALYAASSPADASTPQSQAGTWSRDDLQRIIRADDLKVSPFREDGVTYGTPTWIWCVEVDGSLYVRVYNGKASRWYQAAVREKAGQVIAAGMTRKVIFEAVDGEINDRIDEAYRAKYNASPYLEPMIGERARAATVRIIPVASGA